MNEYGIKAILDMVEEHEDVSYLVAQIIIDKNIKFAQELHDELKWQLAKEKGE